MFEWFLGDPIEVVRDERSFLLSIKQLLPKALNLLPDSEYVAIFNSIVDSFIPGEEEPTFVETGVGASTIVLAYCAAKFGGHLFSWDPNELKGGFIRQCLASQIGPVVQKEVSRFWTFISHPSTQEGIGIHVLDEIAQDPVYAFFDGEHTWDVLKEEVIQASAVGAPKMIFAIDDGNYRWSHTNTARVNLGRRKLGLSPIASPSDNIGAPFYVQVGDLLQQMWTSTKKLNDTFKNDFEGDHYYAYYACHHRIAADLGLQTQALDGDRFSCWQVEGKNHPQPQ